MPSRRKRTIFLVAGVLIAAFIAGVAVSSSLGARGSQASAGTPTAPAFFCNAGVPRRLCDPSFMKPGEPQKGIDPTIPSPNPNLVVPQLISCGQNFFSNTDAVMLEHNNGAFECYRVTGDSTWEVFASGVQTPSGNAAPGGGLIATLTCSSSDSSCMDPNATHSLSEFTAFYPPDPQTGTEPFKYVESTGSHLFVMNDSTCSDATYFDNTDDLYYAAGPQITALATPGTPENSTANAISELEQLISNDASSPGEAQSVQSKLLSALSSGGPATAQELLAQLNASEQVLPATALPTVEQVVQDVSDLPAGVFALKTPPSAPLATAVAASAPANVGSCS